MLIHLNNKMPVEFLDQITNEYNEILSFRPFDFYDDKLLSAPYLITKINTNVNKILFGISENLKSILSSSTDCTQEWSNFITENLELFSEVLPSIQGLLSEINSFVPESDLPPKAQKERTELLALSLQIDTSIDLTLTLLENTTLAINKINIPAKDIIEIFHSIGLALTVYDSFIPNIEFENFYKHLSLLHSKVMVESGIKLEILNTYTELHDLISDSPEGDEINKFRYLYGIMNSVHNLLKLTEIFENEILISTKSDTSNPLVALKNLNNYSYIDNLLSIQNILKKSIAKIKSISSGIITMINEQMKASTLINKNIHDINNFIELLGKTHSLVECIENSSQKEFDEIQDYFTKKLKEVTIRDNDLPSEEISMPIRLCQSLETLTKNFYHLGKEPQQCVSDSSFKY